MTNEFPSATCGGKRLASTVFIMFLLTLIVSRVLVIGSMARTVPNLFLHLGGTHVHCLNDGILLLAAVERRQVGQRCAASLHPEPLKTEPAIRPPMKNIIRGWVPERRDVGFGRLHVPLAVGLRLVKD